MAHRGQGDAPIRASNDIYFSSGRNHHVAVLLHACCAKLTVAADRRRRMKESAIFCSPIAHRALQQQQPAQHAGTAKMGSDSSVAASCLNYSFTQQQQTTTIEIKRKVVEEEQ
jgi:hypothetical protein